MPQLWLAVIISVLWVVFRSIGKRRALAQSILETEKPNDAKEDAYYQIEALPHLDLEQEEPIKFRPFKPKYHLTMSIENSTLSDLVAMDKTYASRIALRQKLIEEEGTNVLALNPIVDPAVFEFYTWMVETYLPTRFPTVYTLTPAGLHNKVTNLHLPLKPTTSQSALELLGSNVDSDFLFLLPPSTPEDDDKYRLQGFVTCFPSGFSTLKKLGMKLAEIHTPVPNYSEKMEKSMDRYFANLPIGKIVKRANWTITTHKRLFCLDGNHISEADRAALNDGLPPPSADDEIDIDQTVVRCERQTLHRLPNTRALVFSFKTYQYPLRELRDEGSGEMLCEAIDGLGRGNVPEMKVYKRAAIWGDRVKQFLREGV
ncbi:hypothetical protein BU24DRAFT_462503 [Aaosphaeria arxii CBS 175.79]|uniref:HRQ family protein 2 n=1 Tax=Aaosphaeria arxii CBS 175.79 TaxID=1450172 RepID=A0A6A5XSM4_9PLEO|nr:uncharacterized protein BU24DRAFT_462503 [Aaosphaeria arxii CBS 175.79]KAF2016335.1 hypothetical protein BU24DRAFT_462503 [Aaosphaeria arxii CBS 175.79]